MLAVTGNQILFTTESGRFNKDAANGYFTQGVLLSAGFSVLCGLLVALGCPVYLDYIAPAPAVRAFADEYFGVYALMSVTDVMLSSLGAFIYVDGGVRRCAAGAGAFFIFRILGGYILCRYYGIVGLPLSGLIGNLAFLAVLCGHFLTAGCSLKIRWAVSWESLRRALWLSLSPCSDLLFSMLAGLFYAKIASAKFGTEGLLVLVVVNSLLFFGKFYNGISTAVQPLVGVYSGERNPRGVARVWRLAFWWALGLSLPPAVALFCMPDLVAWFFNINASEYVEPVRQAVRFAALLMPFTPFIILWGEYLPIIGHNRLAVFYNFGRSLVLPVAVVYCASFFLGSICMVGGMAGAAFCLLLFWAGCWAVLGFRRAVLVVDRSREERIFMYDIPLAHAEVSRVSEDVSAKVLEFTGDKPRAYRGALWVEEVLLAVREHNPGKKLFAEISLDLNDIRKARLTFRDNGVVFNLTDTDNAVSSFSDYFLGCLLSETPDRVNLTTVGCNRNSFQF